MPLQEPHINTHILNNIEHMPVYNMSNINNMLIDSYAEKAIQIISKYYEVVSIGIDKEIYEGPGCFFAKIMYS